MKTFPRQFLSAIVALFLVCPPALLAQEATKSGTVPAPEPPPAAAVATAPATATPEPAVAPTEAESPRKGLRRIDAPTEPAPAPKTPRRAGASKSGEPPFGDHSVPQGREVREIVSLFGSVSVDGTVRSDAVAVFGDNRVGPEGRVGGAAVAVLGRAQVDGEVKRDVVSVLGGVTLNGPIGGELVSVLGDVHLGPKAVVGRDLVVIGGKLTRDPAAIVQGKEVNIPGLGVTGSMEWLTNWLRQCAVKGRLLGFGPNLGWAWLVAAGFLGFYALLALLFPRPMVKCVETLETRPGASILASVLTVLLTPVAMVILALTIIGVALVPFLTIGLFFAGLFGKAVMLAWIGRRVTGVFGDRSHGHPLIAVLIGGVLVMLLYSVWGSFLLYKLISWLGLGVVVFTIALSMRREKAARPPAGTAVAGVVPPATVLPAVATLPATTTPVVSAGFVGSAPPPSGGEDATSAGLTAQPTESAPPPPLEPVLPSAAPVPPPLVPPVIAAAALPRAGFFLRLAALAIDGILIGMIVGFISDMLPRYLQFHHGPGGLLLALAAYGAIMWKHKGTTIGGIVCGLKVVRVDGRELDWATAVVRALGCFLSLVVAGLGFIWVAFDDERQSWHDKIAGTTVVIVPKGQSLI